MELLARALFLPLPLPPPLPLPLPLTLPLSRPDEEEWGLSDHGVVTSTFVAQRRGEAEVTAWIEQRSRAEKAATSDA